MAKKDIDPRAVAARLKSARQLAGYTQLEFSDLLGTAPRTYQLYEQGVRVPPGTRLSRIAKLLNCEPDWLLFGDDTVQGRLAHVEAELAEMRRAWEEVLRLLSAPAESNSGA